MKLHLPRTLLATLLACFALHAQGDAVIIKPEDSTSIPDVPDPGTETPTTIDLDTWTYEMGGIPLDSNLTCSKNFAIAEFSWEASPGATLTMKGRDGGRLVVLSEKTIMFDRLVEEGGSTDVASFTMEALSFAEDMHLFINEGTEVHLSSQNYLAFEGVSLYVNGGSVDGVVYPEVINFNGGSVKGSHFDMLELFDSHSLYLRYALIDMLADPDGGSSSILCDVHIHHSSTIQFNFWEKEWGNMTCAPLHIDGYLSLQETLLIACKPEEGRWYMNHLPNSPCLLITCNGLTSRTVDDALSLIDLQLNGLDAGQYSVNQTIYGDKVAIYLGMPGATITPPTPDDSGDLTSGDEGGDMWGGLTHIDGSGYDYTKGTISSGIVNIAEGTPVSFTDAVTIGSGTAPASGEPAAAVNNAGKITAKSISITNASMLNEGSISTADGISVESGGVLRNDGEVNAPVSVADGGLLQGAGDYTQPVTIASGATQRNGNSPGYNEYRNGLTYEGGANAIFTVDGTNAATRGGSTEGTHSYTYVSGGTLTLSGTVNTTVEITAGILNAGTAPFTLTLLEVAGGGANVDDNGGTGGFAFTLLDDPNGLLADGSAYLVWDKDAGTLLFHGEVDPARAVRRMVPDASALANTLWSSTSAVRAFARNATTQLSSPVQVGKVTTWGSGLGDFVTMSGFRSNAYGYAVGADKQFCPHVHAGIALGQMFGDYNADRGLAEVEQDGTMVGVYGEYRRELNKRHGFSVTGYAAYGRVENDADTRLLGSNEVPGTASWDDDVFSAGFRAHWNMKVADKWTLSPFIGLEYLRGEQSSFSEHYAGGSREYWGGAMQVWSLPVGVTAGTEIELGGGQKLLPWMTVGYVGDVSRENPRGSFRAYGAENRHEGTAPGRHGFMLNAGANWQISESWSAGASYNFETRSHETSHEGNFSLRYAF